MKHKFLFIFLFLISICCFAAPLLNQTGNLLQNGSIEGGNFDPVTAESGQSAASYWHQWRNSSTAPTTEMITEAEMQSLYGTGVREGSAALRVKTYGASDGPYTVGSFGHTAWTAAGVSNVPYTFSGWIYVVSGSMSLAAGSNSYGYNYSSTTKVGQWEFVSTTRTANRVDELLLYSNGPSEFIVDSLWLNLGSNSLHPDPVVPECSSLVFLGLFTCFVFFKKH